MLRRGLVVVKKKRVDVGVEEAREPLLCCGFQWLTDAPAAEIKPQFIRLHSCQALSEVKLLQLKRHRFNARGCEKNIQCFILVELMDLQWPYTIGLF